MKRLLILIILFSIGSSAYAQDPDPDLFQTWYLYAFDPDHIPIIISEIVPPISPFLTITENLEFNGTGACNSFNGTYSVPYENALEVIEYTDSSDDCGFQSHNSFESQYFGFMANGFEYEIIQDSDGLILLLSTPLMSWAEYRNYPLSTTDLNLDKIKIYPNPSHSVIFIESNKNPITKIELLNLFGAKLQSETDRTDSIDISDLASGIYLLRLFQEKGSTIRKIVKQ